MTSFSFKPKTLALAASFTALAGFTFFFSLKSVAADDVKAAPPKAALTVSLVQPRTGQLPIQLNANGNIAAWQEASIGSEVNGLRLLEVRAGVGDTVRAGQVLAVFSADSVKADVAQVRASLTEAQANAQEAAGNAQRARTLQATGALSEQQINQYLTAEQTALARVEAVKASLAVQMTRLKSTTVLAPDSGVISARSATVGAVLGNGVELFRMIRKGRLEWRAEVTSTEVARIKPGAEATITAASGTQVLGKVRMVAPTVDAQTRNALVYVDLPQHADLKAGMYAKGSFALGASTAITLPQQALVLRDGFTYALRVDANNKVQQVKLQTGRRAGDAVEILQGTQAGEQYVGTGAAFLADGDTVKVVAATASNPAPAKPVAPKNPMQPATK